MKGKQPLLALNPKTDPSLIRVRPTTEHLSLIHFSVPWFRKIVDNFGFGSTKWSTPGRSHHFKNITTTKPKYKLNPNVTVGLA